MHSIAQNYCSTERPLYPAKTDLPYGALLLKSKVVNCRVLEIPAKSGSVD
jgi:hypothetical protein